MPNTEPVLIKHVNFFCNDPAMKFTIHVTAFKVEYIPATI